MAQASSPSLKVPLKDVIDNLSTPLSLPIAGWKQQCREHSTATSGLGIISMESTAHHNVFPQNRDNEYNYVGMFFST